jgi:AraC-like DNA-binding protein
MGKTPGAWMTELQQYEAITLLSGGYSIKETASSLGFKQQTNFSRKFKEFWGDCPSKSPSVGLAMDQRLAKRLTIGQND